MSKDALKILNTYHMKDLAYQARNKLIYNSIRGALVGIGMYVANNNITDETARTIVMIVAGLFGVKYIGGAILNFLTIVLAAIGITMNEQDTMKTK